jgi:hypothetical protein
MPDRLCEALADIHPPVHNAARQGRCKFAIIVAVISQAG